MPAQFGVEPTRIHQVLRLRNPIDSAPSELLLCKTRTSEQCDERRAAAIQVPLRLVPITKLGQNALKRNTVRPRVGAVLGRVADLAAWDHARCRVRQVADGSCR